MADNNKTERLAPAEREGGTERLMGRGGSCASGIKNKSEGENSLGWECRGNKGGVWVQRLWGPDVTAGAAFSHFFGQC